jgi:hypothetical protein
MASDLDAHVFDFLSDMVEVWHFCPGRIRTSIWRIGIGCSRLFERSR